MAGKNPPKKNLSAPKKVPAKKAPAKSAATAPAVAPPEILGPGPCDRGDQMFDKVVVAPGQKVEAFFILCSASGMVRPVLSLAGGGPGTPIGEASVIPPDANPRVDRLTPLVPARYVVSWDYAVAGPFQMVAELLVDDVPRFRRVRTYKDSLAVGTITAPLEVK